MGTVNFQILGVQNLMAQRQCRGLKVVPSRS